MRYNDKKLQFFRIVYKVCKESSIDFRICDYSYLTIEQQKIFEIFQRRNKTKQFKEFIGFYRSEEKKENNLIILSMKQNPEGLEGIGQVIKRQIYGGFVYLDRKKYLLLDRSYATVMSKITAKYKTLKNFEETFNKEENLERNNIHENR